MASVEIFDVAMAVLVAVLIAGVCRNRGWSSAIPLMAAGILVGLAPFGPEGLAHPEFVLVVVLAPLVFGEGLTSSIVDLRKVSRPIMALAVGPNRFPRRADYERVGDEVRRAHRLFTDRGWIDDPMSFHRAPPALVEPSRTRGWALGTSYERLWWPSGFEPRLGVPGTDRWLAFEANRTASAWVLRHEDRDRPRPWLVCSRRFALIRLRVRTRSIGTNMPSSSDAGRISSVSIIDGYRLSTSHFTTGEKRPVRRRSV